MPRARFALALSALILTAGGASASDLLLNGQASVSVAQGLPVSLTLQGTPGAPAWLLADVSPGPTAIFGQALPVGFTPAMVVQLLGPVPVGGTLELTGTLPFDLELIGVAVYLVAAVADAPQPPDYDWSDGAVLRIRDRDEPLAGNSLAGYPDFEFVRAFNANAAVTVALDPARHPEAVGRTGDVYVTAKKSRAQWLSDPALVDVSGGAESLTFVAGGVLDNDVVVAASGVLSAAAGHGLGVGYDVVIDLDQDGAWDGDDLIDGLSDEAGLYRVHDTTLPGPSAVTEVLYSGGTWLGQDLYYPSDSASLPGLRPLVVVSHGNGHNYQWYDHIGEHLASYGFVVMSHQNNTVPGIETASTTTLTNTDYLLANLATIAGGALLGRVDGDNIMWIGHSRGGEGIVRAYDRLIDGSYTAAQFTAADVRLLSSMAPTDFLGTSSATPHGVDYHLWVGAADNDVTGCVSNNVTQSFHLHDRAEGRRLSTSLHGVGHGDFHDSTGSVASGPCLVGKPGTHTIMRGYLLPLALHHLLGNVPAQDFLWRQWERFRPIGAPDANACVVVDLMFRKGAAEGTFVLDDFQTNTATGTSSSGGPVSGSVTIVGEGRLDDEDTTFTWDGDAFNGFSHGQTSDGTRGLVVEYAGTSDVQLEFGLPGGSADVSNWDWLSFRVAQSTRHPLTIAALLDSTFTVELRDGSGQASALNIGVYGGGAEEPYQRTSCGTGTGWGNEFETIRIRLTDFTRGTDLDLADLAAVTLRFGPSFSSPASGRLGLDDLQFDRD